MPLFPFVVISNRSEWKSSVRIITSLYDKTYQYKNCNTCMTRNTKTALRARREYFFFCNEKKKRKKKIDMHNINVRYECVDSCKQKHTRKESSQQSAPSQNKGVACTNESFGLKTLSNGPVSKLDYYRPLRKKKVAC